MIVTGYIKLRKPILISGECLNKTFELEINSIKGYLKTPKLPPKYTSENEYHTHNLEHPDSDIKFTDDYIDWGETNSWPTGNSFVQNFLLEFEFINEEVFKNSIFKIEQEISNWIQRFTTNLYSSGYNIDLNLLTVHDEYQDNFNFFYRDTKTGNIKKAIEGKPSNLSVIVRDPLSIENFKMIINATSKYKNLRLEYILLKDAQQALSEKTYRKSVLDSASAIEVSLTNNLKNNLGLENGLLYEVLKMNNSISKKRKLLKYTGIKLPSHNYQRDLEDIRNRAIHAGRKPNQNEARKIYSIANEIIPILSPEKFE